MFNIRDEFIILFLFLACFLISLIVGILAWFHSSDYEYPTLTIYDIHVKKRKFSFLKDKYYCKAGSDIYELNDGDCVNMKEGIEYECIVKVNFFTKRKTIILALSSDEIAFNMLKSMISKRQKK